MLGGAAVAADETGVSPAPRDAGRTEAEPGGLDSGRFYLFLHTGQEFWLDESFTHTVDFDTADGFNHALGGGFGYNFNRYWGLEFVAGGTEPDLRQDDRGKVNELSLIRMMPAVRLRYPMGEDGRLVPFLLGGVGYAIADINDSGNARLKLDNDETSIAGLAGFGIEYFVSPNVAIGTAFHYYIHPDTDTRFTGNDVSPPFNDVSSVNLSGFDTLIHVRLYPGQGRQTFGGREQPLKWFLGDGPYDTDEVRVYMNLIGGHTFVGEPDFGGDIKAKAPGDFDATLGGGIGVNLSRHWGFEVMLNHTEENLEEFFAGKIAELGRLAVIPAVRFRWPFLDGRLVPFVTAGVGAAFNTIGDDRILSSFDDGSVGRLPKLRIQNTSIAGSVSAGTEYFLNHHLAVGLAIPYYFYPDWSTGVRELDLAGNTTNYIHDSVNLSGPALLLQIKVLLP
jgi:opacity protein-like surface antigen